jgi:hypothetical protein
VNRVHRISEHRPSIIVMHHREPVSDLRPITASRGATVPLCGVASERRASDRCSEMGVAAGTGGPCADINGVDRELSFVKSNLLRRYPTRDTRASTAPPVADPLRYRDDHERKTQSTRNREFFRSCVFFEFFNTIRAIDRILRAACDHICRMNGSRAPEVAQAGFLRLSGWLGSGASTSRRPYHRSLTLLPGLLWLAHPDIIWLTHSRNCLRSDV